jgi:hypothetical protein
MNLRRLLPFLAVVVAGGGASAADMSVAIRVTINAAASSPGFASAITRDIDRDGHIDHLDLTFTTAMNVFDPGGSSDALPGLTLSDGYLIAPGNYAATDITTLRVPLVRRDAPDTGVKPRPTYDAGSGTFFAHIEEGGSEMTDGSTVATADGAAPVLAMFSPVSGQEIDQADLSWTVTEDLAAGTVTFTRTGGTADPTVHRSTLTTAELTAGLHDALPLANTPSLVNGAAYTVTLGAQDAAGNQATPVSASNVRFVRVVGIGTRRPRIVSDAALQAEQGDRWTYDVTVDVSSIQPALSQTGIYDLRFGLATAPTGAVITKTGPTTARVTWTATAADGAHRLVVVRVIDAASSSTDRQEVLIHVVAPPEGGG